MSIVGRTYLMGDEPVTIVTQWATPLANVGQQWPLVTTRRTAPLNVEVERADGRRFVRPFRGLRRPQDSTNNTRETAGT